jgi:hypothetical protein
MRAAMARAVKRANDGRPGFVSLNAWLVWTITERLALEARSRNEAKPVDAPKT